MWTSSVCFLCVKTFKSDSKYPHNAKTKFNKFSSRRFALFCERFLKLPPESPLISILCSERNQAQSSARTSSSSSSSFLDQCCSECLDILDRTFQLYNELCEVQLKMAWRLGQLEALLKPRKSKPSSKLSSLLLQKLSEQLRRDRRVGKVDTEEVGDMRNILLLHCKSARNQMVDHRKLEVALDRSSVPEPLLGGKQGKSFEFPEAGTTTTSFLVLDSNLSNNIDNDVVKQELDDYSHDSDHADEFTAMDFDFPNTSPKQELTPPSSSFLVAPESKTVSRLRRSAKTKKPPLKKVKVEKPKIKKQNVVATTGDGIPCEVCGEIIPTINKLNLHYQCHVKRWRKLNKGKKPPFQCHFCYQSFITKQQRWIHQEIGGHDRDMTSVKFTCYEEACTGMAPFSSFEDLETHFENVHRNESGSVHKCGFCKWPFSSDDMRQVHELVHGTYIRSGHKKDQKRSFKCPMCSQDFKKFPPLQTHFITEHTNIDSERIYKCHKCSKAFNLPRTLTHHLKTHEMEEDLANTQETGAGSSNMSEYFICEECGKHCATSTILTIHKLHIHRTKQCDLCGETVLGGLMSRHRRYVHKVGVKPEDFCRICGKFFPGKSRMTRHMKSVHLQQNVTTHS